MAHVMTPAEQKLERECWDAIKEALNGMDGGACHRAGQIILRLVARVRELEAIIEQSAHNYRASSEPGEVVHIKEECARCAYERNKP